MIPISSAVRGGLTWSRASHKCAYQLRRSGELVASLQRRRWWSTEYEAESQHGNWRLCRTGFWRTVIEIVDTDSGQQIATLWRYWRGGGKLIFSDHQTFQLICKGFWRPVWTVVADSGQSVLSIHSREKTVELPNETHLPDDRLTLLVVVAWHAMQQAAQDASAGVAVAAAIS